jgi:hypothetical protein
VRVDDDTDPRITCRGVLGHGGGLRVVVPDDHDDLEVGVARLQQPLDRVVQHGLFVPGGQQQQQREGDVLVPVRTAESGGGEHFRRTPGVHLPPQSERRHPEQGQ